MSLVIVLQANGFEPEAKIVAQRDSPIEISSYTALYEENSVYSPSSVYHALTYRNTSEKTIVAVRFGLVSFDIWNEFLDYFGGLSIEDFAPGATEEGDWYATTCRGFTFLTGFAYVSRVRFSDGTIWIADTETIAEEMRKIEQNFDIQELQENPCVDCF